MARIITTPANDQAARAAFNNNAVSVGLVNNGVLSEDGERATGLAAVCAPAAIVDNGNSGAAKTVAWDAGDFQKITLTASAPTITFTSSDTNGAFTLVLVQDGTGSRLLPTFSPAADYGTAGAPTLSTAPAKIDMLYFVKVGAAYRCTGSSLGFSA